MVTKELDDVVNLLDLEAIEVNMFRGFSPPDREVRVFGGQVAGQALVAAARTVDEFQVHSLHAYFLRPGDPSVPILYDVDRIRDGRSFATRRVVAIQHGKAIFNLAVSFQKVETGAEHQIAMPDVPGPDELPSREDLIAEFPDRFLPHQKVPGAFDMRYVDGRPHVNREHQRPEQFVWLKSLGNPGSDQLINTVLLTYASDMSLLDTATLPHGFRFGDPNMVMASLDHAMWFHRPFRIDEWLLYAQESQSASAARGIARGLVFRQSGELVASVMQEGLLREIGTSKQK